MSNPPYDPKKITPDLYGDRSPVEGRVVAILHVSFKDRGLKLIDTKSRAVLKHEIHEIMITDEKKAAPGGGADRVAAVAFFEITKGGLIVTGDRVTAAGTKIGESSRLRREPHAEPPRNNPLGANTRRALARRGRQDSLPQTRLALIRRPYPKYPRSVLDLLAVRRSTS